MATQKSARLASELGGMTGTVERNIITMGFAAFIDSQNNPLSALAGGKFVGPDRKTLKSVPPLIRTRKTTEVLVEGFTQEHIQRNFEVLSGAAASGTAITLEAGAEEKIHAGTIWRVNESRDVFYCSALTSDSSDVMTIARVAGASVINAGDHIELMGYIRGELSSNPVFVVRDEVQHSNYCAELYKAIRVSKREGNIKRNTGDSFENQKRMKMLELLADRDSLMIGGKSTSTLDGTGLTAPRGLESWALDGAGDNYDFGGTVERSEIRAFGTKIAEYAGSDELIMLTGLDQIGIFSSVLDDKLRIDISDFKKQYGLPLAESFRMGPATVKMVPHAFYKGAGNNGRGVVFDAKNVAIYELNDIEFYEAKPFSDSTFTSDRRGMYYYDGACIVPLDGGKSITVFEGANSYS